MFHVERPGNLEQPRDWVASAEGMTHHLRRPYEMAVNEFWANGLHKCSKTSARARQDPRGAGWKIKALDVEGCARSLPFRDGPPFRRRDSYVYVDAVPRQNARLLCSPVRTVGGLHEVKHLHAVLRTHFSVASITAV